MEASGGRPAWQFIAHVDIGEEGPKMLVEIDASWRAKWWLEVATKGIRDEVLWNDLLTPLTSGAEGTTKALPNVWWPCGDGTLRFGGKECACQHSLCSTSASSSLTRRWGQAWESCTGLWLTPMCYKEWERQPTEGSGTHGKRPWRSKPPRWCMPFGMRLMWT